MIVVGLHFGHDGAVAVICDGEIRSYVLRERITRTKHALGIDIETIERALDAAETYLEDIDCVAVSSTQHVELIIEEPDRMDIKYVTKDPFGRPMTLGSRFHGLDHAGIAATCSPMLLDHLYSDNLGRTYIGQMYRKVFPQYMTRSRGSFRAIPWVDTYIVNEPWEVNLGLYDLRAVRPEISDRLRYGFHLPVEVSIDGRRFPGYAVHHHFAHAASSFFTSGHDEAAILTHDGFGLLPGYHGGMFYYGKDEALFPLWPHHLTIGYLYEFVASSIGLGVVGGSGKLMGLAPYGCPTYFDHRFVGNVFDFDGKFRDVSRNWIIHCRSLARARGYDSRGYADPSRATEPINADIAASTQRLFEVTRLEAVESLRHQLENAGVESLNLCLSGGTALNCPSNSEIARSRLFDNVYVEPACDDGGIAIGAALAAYHNILGYPRVRQPTLPYLGKPYTHVQVADALSQVNREVEFEACEDPATRAALDLTSNRIVGWFEGGSEVGPRALGHRSILADPRQPENWLRVNRVKRREPWRPFAPSVLVAFANHWFEDLSLPAPYMLFNARVTGDLLPAVTHVDGTSRIQTVDDSCGFYFNLIEAFRLLTGVPVVLNTSLNGPGEAIAETPDDALAVFLSSGMDVLYLDGIRVIRSPQSQYPTIL